MKRSKMTPIYLLVLVIFIFGSIPFTGCNSTSVSNKSPGSIEKALSIMPDFGLTIGNGSVFITDYAKIRNIFNVALPTTETDQSRLDYHLALDSVAQSAGFYRGNGWLNDRQYIQITNVLKENIGFDITSMDIEVGYEGAPGAVYEELIGRYDPLATQDALSHRDKWPQATIDKYTTENYRNVVINSWGDGSQANKYNLMNTMSPPISDNLGRNLPIAVAQSKVFYSYTVDNIKKMIDASVNKSASLAGIPEYDTLAKGLDELGSYSAIICSGDTYNNKGIENFGGLEDIGNAPLLNKYIAAARGIGKDERGAYVTIILVQDNPDSTTANAKILQERIDNTAWNTPVSQTSFQKHTMKEYITDTQIEVKGNAVIAKLYSTKSPSIWISPCHLLLLHE
jgi:hypothetical protein